MPLMPDIPKAWSTPETEQIWARIRPQLEREYAEKECCPPPEDIFRALELLSPEQVRVVIIGQDPYHEAGQANGLAFAVGENCPMPPSLRNIIKEAANNVGTVHTDRSLLPWVWQGVLLLNTALSTEQGKAGVHKDLGWSELTKKFAEQVAASQNHVVWMLWGAHASGFAALAEQNPKHLVLCAAHPSPLSAYRGFFGCDHFLKANRFFEAQGERVILW